MIITQTPVRVSLVGGGTDLPAFYQQEDGAVITTAIDRYVYVTVKPRFDRGLRVRYSRVETVEHVSQLRHELVREALHKTGLDADLEIDTLGDLPAEGTGLGSSSALAVGLLHAFSLYQGKPKDAETLAREACEIEIDILGKPIGKQDQYIAALGGLRKISFHRDGTVTHSPLPLARGAWERLNASLTLFYTGITGSGDQVLEQQRANTNHRYQELRELKAMVGEVEKALIGGHPDTLGEILHESWRVKKTLAEGISNPLIDEMYGNALRGGALGGKISGAGGRGFLLLYVPPERRESLRAALRGFREVPIALEPAGTRVLLDTARPGAPIPA